MALPSVQVEYKTMDGLILRGVLYPTAGKSPAVVMTNGINCVKELLYPDIARKFQEFGYNTLIYDSRSIGESEGLPRNQIDPLLQCEDIMDLVTHVSSLPHVDSENIILFGLSLGGSITGCAAAMDPRIKALIMVCPIFNFFQQDKMEKAFHQLVRDRQSQLRGNKPFSMPVLNNKGENIIGFGGSGGPGGLELYNLMAVIGSRASPNHRNHVTLQTWLKFYSFRPKTMLNMIRTPTLMIVPELDVVSPANEQVEAFELIPGPKTLHLVKGKGHLGIFSGQGSVEIIDVMVGYMNEATGLSEAL